MNGERVAKIFRVLVFFILNSKCAGDISKDNNNNKSVSCGKPGVPLQGKVKSVKTIGDSHDHDFPSGYEMVYSCDEGYVLKGKSKRVCGNDGHWIGSTPTCRKCINDRGKKLSCDL